VKADAPTSGGVVPRWLVALPFLGLVSTSHASFTYTNSTGGQVAVVYNETFQSQFRNPNGTYGPISSDTYEHSSLLGNGATLTETDTAWLPNPCPPGELRDRITYSFVRADPALDPEPPSVPTGLAATAVTPGSITLGWGASSDNYVVTGYQVSRNGQMLGMVTGLSTTLGGLSESASYLVGVRARDAAGNWSDWASTVVTTSTAPVDPNSAWIDKNDDGLPDEVIKAGTERFHPFIANSHTECWDYTWYPFNDYWVEFGYFWGELFGDTPGFSFLWDPDLFWLDLSSYSECETEVEPALTFETEAGYEYRLYQDYSGSPDYSSDDWELIAAGPEWGSGTQTYSLGWYDADSVYLAQFFLVRISKPATSMQLTLPNGVALNVGTSGAGATFTIPGGVVSIDSGGLATITTVGGTQITVNANGTITGPSGPYSGTVSLAGGLVINVGSGGVTGTITFPGGAVLTVGANGTGSVAFPGGIAISRSPGGAVGVVFPPGTNPAVAAAVDILGKVAQQGTGPKWSVRKVIDAVNGIFGPIINLPTGGILGAIDVAVTGDGEYELGVQLGDATPVWFDIGVETRIEFRAREGRLNDGFDPPLPEPEDQNLSNRWYTTVAKTAPHNINNVVKLAFPSVELAQQFELFVPDESQAHVDVSPKTFSTTETDLQITGKNAGAVRAEAEIHLRRKGATAVYGTLFIDVLPWREVTAKLFTVEPGEILIRGKIALGPMPTVPSIQSELNARFRQACISFHIADSAIEAEYFEYDTDPQNGVFEMNRRIKTLDGYENSDDEVEIMESEADRFDGSLNIVFVRFLGDTRTDSSLQPPDDTDKQTLGVCFQNRPALAGVAFVSADRWLPPAFDQATTQDELGASRTIQRVAAHEIGHALGLSTRVFVVDDVYGITEVHDSESFPNGTTSLLRSGPMGPPGQWMRHEDWRKANDQAGRLAP
jgi:hypothetical protein